MKITSLALMITLLLVNQPGQAQDLTAYPATEGTIIIVEDNYKFEAPLKDIRLSMSENTRQLTVQIPIPNWILQKGFGQSGRYPAPGSIMVCRINVDPGIIQDNITSSKVFKTGAEITMDKIVRFSRAEYMPLPSGPDQDGNFNVFMNIRFNPCDYYPNKQNHAVGIIRINDARVVIL